MMISVISVRLQPELEQELAELADRTQCSKGWLINEALGEFIRVPLDCHIHSGLIRKPNSSQSDEAARIMR